jgi:hypothetical protein
MTIKQIESCHLAIWTPLRDQGAFRYRTGTATTGVSWELHQLGPGTMGITTDPHAPYRKVHEYRTPIPRVLA